MTVAPISFPTAPVPPISSVSPATGPAAGGAAGVGSGADFAGVLAHGIDALQAAQSKADGLAVQAATGDLTNVHDYMIAATEASLATDLTVAVRNKAVEAFTEIMRMPV